MTVDKMKGNITVYSVCGAHDENEDSCYADGNLAIVADGMGGLHHGDVASRIAVDVAVSHLSGIKPEDDLSCDTIHKKLFEAIFAANQAILDHQIEHLDACEMGTTLTIALRMGSRLYVTWCGDSCCYLYSAANGLRRLTAPHSYVQSLIDSGEITVEESYTHPDNSLLSRYVGNDDGLCNPDFTVADLAPDDTVLLCSDGLCGYCREHEIGETLAASAPKSLCRDLASLALASGSDDDITIIAIHPHTPKHPWLTRLLHSLG